MNGSLFALLFLVGGGTATDKDDKTASACANASSTDNSLFLLRTFSLFDLLFFFF